MRRRLPPDQCTQSRDPPPTPTPNQGCEALSSGVCLVSATPRWQSEGGVGVVCSPCPPPPRSGTGRDISTWCPWRVLDGDERRWCVCVHVVYGTCVVLGIPDGFPSGPMSDGSIRGSACSIRESWRKKCCLYQKISQGVICFFPK